MKYLLVLIVVGVALAWLSIGRRRHIGGRGGRGDAPRARNDKPARGGPPATMIACVHCGVHLPQTEALFDAAGRPFCSEAHRLAGPR